MNEDIKKQVKRLVEWFGENYSDMSYRKASLTVALFGYFAGDEVSDDPRVEISKLNSIVESLRILEALLTTLKASNRNEFQWEPHFHREEMPQSLTLSPTFNVEKPDYTALINEIEKIRNELKQTPVKTELLISYITKQASAEGYLGEENG